MIQTTNTTASTEKLNEALAQLNEAAREKRDELRVMIGEKYADLKTALGDATHASVGWVTKEGEMVADTAKNAAKTTGRSVHKHPWYYIGGAAVGGLVLGLLLHGRGRRVHDSTVS